MLFKSERGQVGFNTMTSVPLRIYRELQSLNIYRSENCFEKMLWRKITHVISTRVSVQIWTICANVREKWFSAPEFFAFFSEFIRTKFKFGLRNPQNDQLCLSLVMNNSSLLSYIFKSGKLCTVICIYVITTILIVMQLQPLIYYIFFISSEFHNVY